MSYLKRVQKAVEFIETNLEEDLSLQRVSKSAGFSPYHFHRIFQAHAGEPVMEYSRKRRLTEAAHRLSGSKERLIEIAVTYGFESQASFTRAFKRHFGLSPGQYRKAMRRLVHLEKKRLTPVEIEHRAKGLTFKAQIERWPSFKIVGYQFEGPKSNPADFAKVWSQFDKDSKPLEEIFIGQEAYGWCFASADMIENDKVRYLAGKKLKPGATVPRGMCVQSVRGGNYLRVTHKGPIDRIHYTYDFVFGVWLPKSGYDPVGDFDLELYDHRFQYNSKESELDLLIPVKHSK